MEKREIKIDISTAAEWYESDGELKKVALEAFTVSEIETYISEKRKAEIEEFKREIEARQQVPTPLAVFITFIPGIIFSFIILIDGIMGKSITDSVMGFLSCVIMYCAYKFIICKFNDEK